ncbi:MAG: TlpA family protein disulfide reductase [Acidimicrobiia bacterium]|nr:TlpA family protein disulfide reductase [Acidimicrobiia bacterium]
MAPGPGPDTDDVDPSPEGASAPASPHPPRPGLRGLDTRTLLASVAIALVAGIIAGVLVTQVLGDDGGKAGAGPGPGVGQLSKVEKVPDVAVTRFDGTTARLGDYRGQALVVNFWATWCAPCVREMPEFQGVYTDLGEQVTFVGINVRDDLDSARALARKTGVTYDLVSDADGSVAEAFGVVNFPTTVLVLPDGSIVDTKVGQFKTAGELRALVCGALLGGC